MRALFVHGMGRSVLSGSPMLRRLRQGGLHTSSFGYTATFERFDAIRDRLSASIERLAGSGDNYVLIGHSLGGLLLRAAIAALPDGTPAPRHLFLLGSPVQAPRLAQRLRRRWFFRAATGDCGQLLGSADRMASVSAAQVPTTSIGGTRGLSGRHSPFGSEANDGVVALSELQAPWIGEQIEVASFHTVLPASRQVAEIILQRVRR
ncbi:MAG: alpha/beta hydrolase [Variovorax sp.]|nr:MAG: alpha/beta hydrolase [Variovorax sp.]